MVAQSPIAPTPRRSRASSPAPRPSLTKQPEQENCAYGDGNANSVCAVTLLESPLKQVVQGSETPSACTPGKVVSRMFDDKDKDQEQSVKPSQAILTGGEEAQSPEHIGGTKRWHWLRDHAITLGASAVLLGAALVAAWLWGQTMLAEAKTIFEHFRVRGASLGERGWSAFFLMLEALGRPQTWHAFAIMTAMLVGSFAVLFVKRRGLPGRSMFKKAQDKVA